MKAKVNLIGMAACWAVVLLAGCAGGLPRTPPVSGNQADLMTASDEPEQRRRARLRLELASAYFEQGQIKVALDEIKQSLVIDPSFVEAYNLRGLVYMRLNEMPLAEDSFRRAQNLNPQDASVAHNYGWLLCQQARYGEAIQYFGQAIANPSYTGKAKTLMAQGVCQISAGQLSEAEQSLRHSYELDAGNPVTGYNLASLLYKRGDLIRAQFYIRRLNNSELANAETLWLGIKTEYKLNNREAVLQLAGQLKKRFAQSPQVTAYEKGSFNE
ncbi:MAG: type IV pilus biogenesis/stability protein PilW [Polaromonas sp.]|nr:type IV pilus biogenesis/stability protein PilW [Polaromonas sp.]